jgi:hypothetical protein
VSSSLATESETPGKGLYVCAFEDENRFPLRQTLHRIDSEQCNKIAKNWAYYVSLSLALLKAKPHAR